MPKLAIVLSALVFAFSEGVNAALIAAAATLVNTALLVRATYRQRSQAELLERVEQSFSEAANAMADAILAELRDAASARDRMEQVVVSVRRDMADVAKTNRRRFTEEFSDLREDLELPPRRRR